MTMVEIRNAYCDYDEKMNCREHWYRMVLVDVKTNPYWMYFGHKLFPVTRNERKQTCRAQVAVGSIIAQHDFRGPVTSIWLVRETENPDKPLLKLNFTRKNGKLHITLPDGNVIIAPDPRR